MPLELTRWYAIDYWLSFAIEHWLILLLLLSSSLLLLLLLLLSLSLSLSSSSLLLLLLVSQSIYSWWWNEDCFFFPLLCLWFIAHTFSFPPSSFPFQRSSFSCTGLSLYNRQYSAPVLTFSLPTVMVLWHRLCTSNIVKLLSPSLNRLFQPITPLPSIFLDTYNLSMSLLWWKAAYIMNNFLVFRSRLCYTSTVQMITPVPYLNKDTNQEFMCLNFFWPFNFDLSKN